MATRTTSKQRPEAKGRFNSDAIKAAGNGKAAARAADDVPTEDVSSAADTAFDMVMIGHTEVVQATESSGRAVLDGMAKMQQEVANFVSKRIAHDIEAQQEMLGCRNFDELQAVQTRFLRTAVDHYAAETKRLMRLGSEVVQRSVNREA
jgi:hypothetical protein